MKYMQKSVVCFQQQKNHEGFEHLVTPLNQWGFCFHIKGYLYGAKLHLKD